MGHLRPCPGAGVAVLSLVDWKQPGPDLRLEGLEFILGLGLEGEGC